MKTTHHPVNTIEEPKDLQNKITFSSEAADRKEDDDNKKEQDDEATMDDWGEVDPAGGPAPTAPGSAV